MLEEIPCVQSVAGQLALLTPVMAAIEDVTIRLFKSAIMPTRETTEAELIAQEADFTGYATTSKALPAKAVVGNDSNGTPTAFVESVSFHCTAESEDNSLSGGWIHMGGLVQEWCYFLFNNPINMGTDEAILVLQIEIRLDGTMTVNVMN